MNSRIKEIREKPMSYINGGFFVLSKKIFKFLKNDKSIFEKDCLPKLSNKKELMAYKHNGFWTCMDTLRDKIKINYLWEQKKCPWKLWI